MGESRARRATDGEDGTGKWRPFVILGGTGDLGRVVCWSLRQLSPAVSQELGGLWRGFGVVDGAGVFAGFPQLVAVRLVLVHKHVH